MKSVLYIGQYQTGSTSRMRGEILQQILKSNEFDVIDTSIPFLGRARLFRSVAFRYKVGPVIKTLNKFILSKLEEFQRSHYDLIWVDKGILLTPSTTQELRELTNKLIHFTPDPSFFYHKSKLFYRSLKQYDFLVTTKSFELNEYTKRVLNSNSVILTTQGFDSKIHKRNTSKKTGECVFIGHKEKEREELIHLLIRNKIRVTVAGNHWSTFLKKLSNEEKLHCNYLGKGVFGESYSKTIGNHKIALGFLSKWIPELHTTRTFEIPACGTALLTERNAETVRFFGEDEAIFYSSSHEMIEKIKYFLNHEKELNELQRKGTERVVKGGYSYEDILTDILIKIGLK